jgi:hypothetical protein
MCSAAAAIAVAGKVFMLIIVRILILPACLPPKLFQFLSGCPEDHLDNCRRHMTEQTSSGASRGWVRGKHFGTCASHPLSQSVADERGLSRSIDAERVAWRMAGSAVYEPAHPGLAGGNWGRWLWWWLQEPLAVVASQGLAIDAMVWRGGSQRARRGRGLSGGPEKWAIWFNGEATPFLSVPQKERHCLPACLPACATHMAVKPARAY